MTKRWPRFFFFCATSYPLNNLEFNSSRLLLALILCNWSITVKSFFNFLHRTVHRFVGKSRCFNVVLGEFFKQGYVLRSCLGIIYLHNDVTCSEHNVNLRLRCLRHYTLSL